MSTGSHRRALISRLHRLETHVLSCDLCADPGRREFCSAGSHHLNALVRVKAGLPPLSRDRPYV